MTDQNKERAVLDEQGSSQSGDAVLEKVGQNLLETLEALSTVYESAEHFAGVGRAGPIADYTLERCLEAIGCECGALYLEEDGKLIMRAERQGASSLLTPLALQLPENAQARFHNGSDTVGLVTDEARDRNLLSAPVVAGKRRMGLVWIFGAPGIEISTNDVKLVSAVTSQAAIALSSARYYRDVEIERSKLRSVIEDNSEGIIVLRPDGRTLLCNSVARQLFSIREEESEGLDFLRKLNEWEFEDGHTVFGVHGYTAEIRRGTGARERVISIRSSEVSGADGSTVNIILTLRDLTEKRREEKLKKDFLSLISHKFRTPITAILGILTMLEDENASDEERNEFMTEARNRGDELAVLVDRLLYFAEVMGGSWTTLGQANLHQIKKELHEQMMARHAGKGLVLEWDIGDDASFLRLPPARLRVVLDNLIDNGIKFTVSGSPWVKVTSGRDRFGAIVLQVEDRGPGIAPEARDRVFASFYQQDDDFTGNVAGAGIGLPIVTEIVRRVGGSIEIGDADPAGTVVTLVFPDPDQGEETQR